MKSDDTKPAVLSAARLAEIRERARLGTLPHVNELLAHLDALAAGPAPDGEALGRGLFEHMSVMAWPDGRGKIGGPGWDGLREDSRSYYRGAALALYTRGRTAGRAEGAGSETSAHLIEARNTAQRTAEEAHATIARLQAERDHLKRREESIIEACERVADGGQYRADIVSAIQSLRRDRDTARAELAEARAELADRKRAALRNGEDAEGMIAAAHKDRDAALANMARVFAEEEERLAAARVEGAREERRRLLEQLAFFVKVHSETEDERARGAGGEG